MEKKEFNKLLKNVPKAELHVHQEAVLSKETIKTVYKAKTGNDLSEQKIKELFSYNDLAGFLKSFLEIQSYFTEKEYLKLMLADFKKYLEDNNIVYCETFFSPTGHLKKGWSFDSMMDIVEDALKEIEETTGRKIRLLIDVSRSFGLENAMHNLDLVIERNSPYILGIGLGGDEKKGPAKDYEAVFKKAKEAGLKTVAHAGETCPSWSMKDSLEKLYVARIGHGITASEDIEFMKELAEKQIPLEVCPSSNICLISSFQGKIENHPVRKLFDYGCMITINTDDPTFFNTNLTEELWKVHHNLGFSMKEIKQIIKNAFVASFMNEEEKKQYLDQVDKAMPD